MHAASSQYSLFLIQLDLETRLALVLDERCHAFTKAERIMKDSVLWQTLSTVSKWCTYVCMRARAIEQRLPRHVICVCVCDSVCLRVCQHV